MPEALPPLREVIADAGLSARKSLGQHFLFDMNLNRRIARAVPGLKGAVAFEVGPGPGGLTRALLEEGAGKVVAVEADPRCEPALDQLARAFPNRFSYRLADALACDEARLLSSESGPVHVVANLPYNVGSPLLVKWLTAEAWPPWYRSLTLMFQKEVATRIVAAPGGKAYGRLSVLAQWRAEARKLFDVPAAAFTPPPKVASSVIQIVPGPPCVEGVNVGDLVRILAAAFGKRRKMLRRALADLVEDAETLLSQAGLDGRRRAESLTPEEFCVLAKALGPAGGSP
ncbi:MAG: 16S rRNA (adenine(1518)-N(6)/adenine(1519)-N(6))-dimethyltransferase RsmA [Sphingomonadales bacterium]|nr:16S rRNA (adenine(1518)-N(6)/adenine(1519)-N(6))-dimethyltransferase RsmA [Sphingomonadales bacterium]